MKSYRGRADVGQADKPSLGAAGGDHARPASDERDATALLEPVGLPPHAGLLPCDLTVVLRDVHFESGRPYVLPLTSSTVVVRVHDYGLLGRKGTRGKGLQRTLV